MNNKIIKIACLATMAFFMNACINTLDTEPLDDEILNATSIYEDESSYKQFLAKLYGSLTLTGQRGEAGMPEIAASDEGTTSFLRTYWSVQEISTDEAINAWGDPGLVDFNGHNWSDQNLYIQLLYQRIFINISYCNEYIREVGARVDGLPDPVQEEVRTYLTEARFLRALFYYFALDLWGNVPFVTEDDATGAFLPGQIKRPELFTWIENEILAILPELVGARQNEYARADKGAAWMLLAKMYLNAEVYTGNAMYTECIEMCQNILNAGYSLHDSYDELFLADNHQLRSEIIFPVAEDGNFTRNYGGVTYIIHAAVGGSADAEADFGIGAGGWSGNRLISSFVEKFEDPTGATDQRAIFYTDGQTLEIENPQIFTEGYMSAKFKNITSTGQIGQHGMFVDTDFPLFRLADVYLMYAEAVLRGGSGGNENTALELINDLRRRAYGDNSGDISAGDLTLDFILDERAKELHWEAHRRTDLIRYGLFTSSEYIWDWKGGVKEGRATEPHLTLLPLPSSDLGLNTNLEQNPEY